jgi:oligopeptidase B
VGVSPPREYIDQRNSLSRSGCHSAAFHGLHTHHHGHEYDLEDHGDRFVVRTNGAFIQIMDAPLDRVADRSLAHAFPRVRHVITAMAIFTHYWAVAERSGGISRIRLIDQRDYRERLLERDAAATLWLDVNADASAPFLRFAWGSLAQPTVREELDFATGRTRVLRVDPVEGGHEPNQYVVERRWIRAPRRCQRSGIAAEAHQYDAGRARAFTHDGLWRVWACAAAGIRPNRAVID